MAASAGKDFLLQSGDGGAPEVFTVLGGLRSTSLALNAEVIDVTDQNAAQWQTLLSGAGIHKMSISGSGIFNNTSNEQLAITRYVAQTINNYRIVDGAGHSFTCGFKITKLDRKGDYKSAQDYSMTLESSGPLVYV